MEIREAKPGDEEQILELITELAIYEKEPDAVINTAKALHDDLFVSNLCDAFVAMEGDEMLGFALYYTSYSTWKGPCIYLEDLYVQEAHRTEGIGSKLFDRVVEEAKNRKVHRMDWQVLDWNTPAIDFYKRKNALLDGEWLNGRLFFEYD